MTLLIPMEVLLIEDNHDHAQLISIALKDSTILINMNVVEDGVEAMAFLLKQDKYALAPRPDLVLLDLDLPKKDGWSVLTEIKTNVNLRRIPVVILATSPSEEDMIKAYDLAASSYIIKPVNFEQWMEIMQVIKNFWFLTVKLPPK
ncbi:response regulator [Nostocaceae cyanobacterium CENA357]|uniref:Response regulator n=1 Tax=Atlanticothrix silvestris CENA357 TaxID=1725252 RepID=A0A8J7L3L0_9CYAN|nr:response regulator [Atlanticothrix silvestris]MBH8553901.1 response regulator [Atlanticothrix silvestris CENA357]